jgi:hypothetical protein
MGTSASVLVEDMSRENIFSRFEYHMFYVFTCDLFTESPSYIMVPEQPISAAYFINTFHQSVCMYIPPIVARQRLGKHIPAAAIHTTIKELLDACICGSACVSPYRC